MARSLREALAAFDAGESGTTPPVDPRDHAPHEQDLAAVADILTGLRAAGIEVRLGRGS